MEFRNYQNEIIKEGTKKISALKIILLAMEVRTGKTLTAFGIANALNVKKVLFITKKKIMDSNTILNDYNLLNPAFQLEIINYESVHKINTSQVDLFIVDESHSLGAFPKPSLRTKNIKALIGNKFVILLSGTPTPESWSQIYHQFWISNYSPFSEKSFYKWAINYVTITKKYLAHGNKVNDYTNAKQNLINQIVSKYIISYSQSEAGFASSVEEEVLFVKMKDSTYNLAKKLENDLVVVGKNGGVILGDTPVKLMQKVHQIYSGTIKLEDGTAVIIDDSKAQFIARHFYNKKIAIYYKFKEELNLLMQVFEENLTTDIHEFNDTNKNIALQITAGREGISLKKAANIVFYNIDFSATSYWQARDRMTTKDRIYNKVYWIFSDKGLEEKIYKTVQNKKNFTTNYYERTKTPKQNNQTIGERRLVRSQIN